MNRDAEHLREVRDALWAGEITPREAIDTLNENTRQWATNSPTYSMFSSIWSRAKRAMALSR